MSTPSLAATADGELENEYYWLACDVCALVGRDRHSACHLNNEKLFARRRCLRPRWPGPQMASWKMDIIGSPAMFAPSLAVTAIRLAV
jgi:hypothetical protein